MQQRVLRKNVTEGSVEECNIGFCKRIQHRVLQKNATVQKVLQ